MKARFLSTYLNVLIIFLVALVSAIIFSHTALLSGNMEAIHMDAQVYIHTAHQLLQGKILYRDVFDHKGPFMYIIECIGVFFSGKQYVGLWFTQWIWLVLGLSPLFIFWARKHSLLLSMTALFFLGAWIYSFKTIGDNLPEIYAISFIAWIYYLCLRMVENSLLHRWYVALLGMSAMGLFLTKPNLIVLVIPCCVWFLWTHFQTNSSIEKRNHLLFILGYILLGVVVVLLPILGYFAYHQALSDAFFAYWTFNFSYISAQSFSMYESFSQVFLQAPLFMLIFVVVALLIKGILDKGQRPFFAMIVATLIISMFILIALPGRGKDSLHYAIPMAPIIGWAIMYIGQEFQSFQRVFLLLMGLYFFKPPLIHSITATPHQVDRKEDIEWLATHKRAGETLCIFGNRSAVYEQTQLTCNTRFFYTYPLMQDCNSSISQQFITQFASNKATWVLVETKYVFDTCITLLLQNYERVYANPETQIYHLKTVTAN